MQEQQKNEMEVIDLRKVFRTILEHKKSYIKWLSIVFILACVWIFPQPRYYTAEVMLAPETGGENVAGGLSSLASSFGFNLGGLAGNDAIYPTLYPDLFESPEFLTSLYDIRIHTADGELETDYYTYMKKYQRRNPYTAPYRAAKRWIRNLLKPKKPAGSGEGGINPFHMSEDDYGLMMNVHDNLKCSNDKKTDVTTIVVTDQDALVCALLADSIKVRLQEFIIRYRTSKARLDLNYYQNLTDSARLEYEKASQVYSDFVDSHNNLILTSYRQKQESLENEMTSKYNAYNAMNTQLQAMRAKVQERTPAFTTLKSPIVPVKPAGPKRILFIAAMLFLTFIGMTAWYCRKELHFTF